MHEFLILLAKIFPLYLLIAAGFFAAKKLKIDRDAVATVLIYIILPVVIFNGVATAPAGNTYLLLPLVFFVISCGLGVLFYKLGGLFWQTAEKNVLGFAAGHGNVGYFGLPLVLGVLGPQAQSIAILSVLGFMLFESTLGYYLIAKGQATAKEAVFNVLKLPLIYAFIFGLIVNKSGLVFSAPIQDLMTNIRGAYVVFGMMIIGIGLASVTRAAFDKKFTLLAFAAKFICYPIAVALFVALDNSALNLFDTETHQVMFLISIVPLASNTVAYAVRLKAHPEKAAFAVLLSTIFALFYIPFFIALFLK